MRNFNTAHVFTGIIICFFVAWFFINLNTLILFKDTRFEFYQLVSSSLVHANFEHIAFNSIALLNIAFFVEREHPYEFVLKWISFALWASFFSYLFEANPVLWASWVAMWLFSYYYLKYRDAYNMQWILLLICLNILIWFMPGISLWGHAGWAIGGGAYYLLEKMKL